jgi:Limiting CO2-inducible proteins B/C beta carbonyic anhydrases
LSRLFGNVQGSGKERYVFFSFPHIGIDARGSLGAISRPGRPGASSACGALKAALADIQGSGLAASCSCPGGGCTRLHAWHTALRSISQRLRICDVHLRMDVVCD